MHGWNQDQQWHPAKPKHSSSGLLGTGSQQNLASREPAFLPRLESVGWDLLQYLHPQNRTIRLLETLRRYFIRMRNDITNVDAHEALGHLPRQEGGIHLM